MSGHVSRGSAGEYQADERAGVQQRSKKSVYLCFLKEGKKWEEIESRWR